MDKENRSYSFMICNKMIDEVFKKDKEEIYNRKVLNMENCILKPNNIVLSALSKKQNNVIIPTHLVPKIVCGSGYKAAKCLRV